MVNDRRFLNLARVQQAKYHNFKIRFKGFSAKTEEESKQNEESRKSIEKDVLSDYAGYLKEQEERRKNLERQKVTKNANELMILSFDASVDHNLFHTSSSKAVSEKIVQSRTRRKKKGK